MAKRFILFLVFSFLVMSFLHATTKDVEYKGHWSIRKSLGYGFSAFYKKENEETMGFGKTLPIGIEGGMASPMH